MPWQFEKIFKTDISAGSQMDFLFDMCHDGKYIWVTQTNGNVKVYEYWGEQDLECKDELEFDKIYKNKFETLEGDPLPSGLDKKKLRKVKTIETPGIIPGYIKHVNGTIYIACMDPENTWKDMTLTSKWTGFITINPTTYEVSEPIVVPEFDSIVKNKISSDFTIAYGKLYFVYDVPQTINYTFDGHHIGCYDFELKSFITPVPINGRTKQFEKISIVDGMNGHIYISQPNDLVVLKYTPAISLVSTIYIGNRNIYKLTVTQTDNTILVSSMNGIVSKIDPVTDYVSNVYNSLNEATDLDDDGTYIWFTCDQAQTLVRQKKSDKTCFFNKDIGDVQAEDGWTFDLSEFEGQAFRRVIVTPAFTYQNLDFDPIFVDKYIFIMTETGLNCFKNDRYLWREIMTEVSGVAMLSSGANDFRG